MRCFCLLSIWSVNMENKCNSCFYALMNKDLEAPCITCTGYSNYVKGTIYMTPYASKPLREAIDDWFKQGANGVTQEDFWTDHDSVHKPKHYMLFKYDELYKYEEGVEVRDVIEKLVDKIHNAIKQDDYPQGYSKPMFVADYVQLMQYLMRFMDKNGLEDLKKARWYLDKLIDAYDEPDF